jgi:hypothetical protein
MKIKKQSLVNKILIEAMLEPIEANVKKFKGKDVNELFEIASFIKNWFSGSFMGGENMGSIKDLAYALNFVGKLYGETPVTKKEIKGKAVKIMVAPKKQAVHN